MNLREALAAAKQRIDDLFASETPRNVRLEQFLYDDHLGVWTLTIGFALQGSPETRNYKVVRVMEADKSVLSIADR